MDRKQIVERVSAISIAVNLILSAGKLAAGILAHSGAMVSDAVHSASDVFSTVIVIIGFRLSSKDADKEHPYGHERLECVAGVILAMILFMTGLGIAKSSFDLVVSKKYLTAQMPGLAALIAAVISIAAKEGMYWLTIIYANQIDSPALKADAWHHRTDALSSVAALIGVGATMLGFPLGDAIASIVICLFILKVAWDVGRDAVGKLVDESGGKELNEAIARCAAECPAVNHVDMVVTRRFGSLYYADVEVAMDGSLTLAEAHKHAEEVHKRIEHECPQVKHATVHVNPVQVET